MPVVIVIVVLIVVVPLISVGVYCLVKYRQREQLRHFPPIIRPIW